MKKLLSVFLASAIVLSSALVTYADKKVGRANGIGKGVNQKSNVELEEKSTKIENTALVDEKLDDLRKQLKENHKDKETRKKLIKEIVMLRKMKNDHSIPVFVNGSEVKFDVPPVIKYNRTLIPVRAVTNALGATVDWDRESNVVTVTKAVYGEKSVTDSVYDETSVTDSVYGIKSIEIKIDLDDGSVTVNGEPVELDVPPQVVNNRTMVPLRFIAETFNMYVDWDKDTGAIIIDDPDGEDEDEDIDEEVEEDASDTGSPPEE